MMNYIKENNSHIEILGIALNGIDALNYLKQDIPDIILLDLQMPKLNGINFLNKIRNFNIDIFILYIANKLKIDNPKYIKWSLQKLLDSMTRYTEDKIILKYFSYTKHPTLKSFISTIDDKIMQKLTN